MCQALAPEPEQHAFHFADQELGVAFLNVVLRAQACAGRTQNVRCLRLGTEVIVGASGSAVPKLVGLAMFATDPPGPAGGGAGWFAMPLRPLKEM